MLNSTFEITMKQLTRRGGRFSEDKELSKYSQIEKMAQTALLRMRTRTLVRTTKQFQQKSPDKNQIADLKVYCKKNRNHLNNYECGIQESCL